MKLVINGEDREFDGQCLPLETLLATLDLGGKAVVVELNRHPVLPDDHANTHVSDGDSLEIVRIAAGG